MVSGREVAALLKKRIDQFGPQVEASNVGRVLEVGDGIARIQGLLGARYNELLVFPGDVLGITLNLEEDQVAAIILGDDSKIREGDEVKGTGHIAEVPVGEGLIGRVIDPLGRPLDDKGPVKSSGTRFLERFPPRAAAQKPAGAKERTESIPEAPGPMVRPLERIAPGVVARKPVDVPVHTGIKAIDSMIPIGRGQRELIIGDRFTGKTAIAMDTIISQKGKDLICIYVAIGQKASKVAQVIHDLETYGAMEHTIVVVANSSDPSALQYLAPYAGCAIGEEFMEQGKDALVVYDDLTKHAWAYRQISLLLRRPPGREAYPGDIFYLHSRLLERAARLSEEYGGGSLTALPIIETQAGDVSAYIPTNVISITDGQIYLEPDLFNAGIRPAINVGISVSRVGSAAQSKAMKKVAGRLKLEMAQYRELAAFAQFGSTELDKTTKAQLERGQRITEILKQPQFSPVPLEEEVLIIYAAVNGYLDDIPVARTRDFESSLIEFARATHPEILETIATDKDLNKETESRLRAAIEEFKKTRFATGL